MRTEGDLLFNDNDLHAVLKVHLKKMDQEIDAIEGNQLLNTSITDLCDYFEEKYWINSLNLLEDHVTIDQKEIPVDVSGDRRRDIRDRSRPFNIPGTEVTYFVPFEGDAELFKCCPSAFTSAPPRAQIRQQELIFKYLVTEHDEEAIRKQFQRDLNEVKRYLGWIERDVQGTNEIVRSNALQRIEWRREKLLKDQGLAAKLGYPLRRRENAAKTYTTHTVQRKPKVTISRASKEPYVPEPALDAEEYEHILEVIRNMVLVMERSPEAFKNMKEEDLRQHFLVQLNGQYQGQATGETFNFEGKTDILIREEGKNLFIAECKFWQGPKTLLETIDQLLGYTSWRDTKTAILLFNRDRQLSTVLKKVPGVIADHPNCKRQIEYCSETEFRFIMHHRDDPNRELILTVLIFEVPV